MNVSELFSLAQWLEDEIATIKPPYETLQSVFHHNSTQSAKQPVADKIIDLQDKLTAMDLTVLSNEQLRLLDELGVLDFFGTRGVQLIKELQTKVDFDPADTYEKVASITSHISSVQSRAELIKKALSGFKAAQSEPEIASGRVLTRIEFRQDASISNIVDWKYSAATWNDIVRGIALAIDEAPEETMVVGATRGSIILELGATFLFVKLLSGIILKVVQVANEITELQKSREDLRNKRLLNDNMAKVFEEAENKRRKDGAELVFKVVSDELPKKINGEQANALKASIGKLLNFRERGGEVDFVDPNGDGVGDDGDDNSDTAVLIDEVRTLIEQVRIEKNQAKLLSTHMAETEDQDQAS